MVRLYEGYVQQLQKGVVARERDLIGRYTSGFSTDQEELDQELAVAYNDLSWFRMLTGHFAEAEEALRKGIERDPSFRNLYSKLAPALLLQGKIDAAKAEYLQRKDQPYIPGRFPTYASAFESILDQLERLQLIPDSLQGAVAEIRQLLQNQ
jgi:tetratricopeptide (TPR) repeat protein